MRPQMQFRSPPTKTHKHLLKYGIAAVAALILTTGGVFLWQHHTQTKPLTDKDVLVLADFTNTTGDPMFDGTLRQGLTVQLEQSPFLNLVTEERIRQVLRMMGQPADARADSGGRPGDLRKDRKRGRPEWLDRSARQSVRVGVARGGLPQRTGTDAEQAQAREKKMC